MRVMNWKLFLSTFVLIFLAELGDKTQLTAMARAAGGEGAKWVVFLAAVLALALSTLIAVLFGSALTRLVPETYIKLAAGILFLVLGATIVLHVLLPRKAAARETHAARGAAARLVFNVAAEFEKASVDDYARLAEQATDPHIRDVLLSLAEDESQHLQRIRSAELAHPLEAQPEAAAATIPGRMTEVATAGPAGDREVLERALTHEKTTATFYREMARTATLPMLRQIFTALADEEDEHVQRLESAMRVA
jgi:rubrerythrin